MIVWLSLLGVLFAGIQVGLSSYSWVFAYIYSISILYSFPIVVVVAFVSGLAFDILRVARLGLYSILLLFVAGLLRVGVGPRLSGSRRNLLVDGLLFLPIAVVDAIIVSSLKRFFGNLIVFVIVYSVVRFVSSRSDAIMIRRSI